jgi:hypothetical protein
MKEIKKIKKSPFFMATAAMFVLPIPTFLAYLVPLDVDVTGNNTAFMKIYRDIHRNVWQLLGG